MLEAKTSGKWELSLDIKMGFYLEHALPPNFTSFPHSGNKERQKPNQTKPQKRHGNTY